MAGVIQNITVSAGAVTALSLRTLVAGSGVAFTTDATNFTIAATAPGHTIADEGSSLPARTVLNFTGAGVTASDDGTRTNITITGGGGAGTGTITSIDVSGGTTGLTFSGGPVTTAGTITMAGTLAIANGGTGATSASAALSALGGQPVDA